MCPQPGQTDKRTNLSKSRALDEIVEFPDCSVPRQTLEVAEEVLLLELEELAIGVEVQRIVPERPDVDASDLGSVEHLAESPHQGLVDSHQLLVIDQVGFVEDDAYLIVMPLRV